MRKSVAVKLAACALAVSVMGAPIPAWANPSLDTVVEKVAQKTVAQQPAASSMPLEKAIAIAKEKVPVPKDLDKFSSDYQEYDGKGRWQLRWYKSKSPEANMHITINALTGQLENMNFYRGNDPGVRYKGLPAFTRDQCLEIARKEGARLLPEKFSSTVLTPREEWYPPSIFSERDYPISYDFYFRRTMEGIQVGDQGISIGINAETGELTRVDCSWDSETKLPSPQGVIGADKAKSIFMEKGGYELTYFLPQREDPDTAGNLKLVYRPKPPGRFILNALTGEVMDLQNVDFYFDDMAGGMGGGPMYSKNEAKSLTPAENKAVQETKDLISADRAQELAVSLVKIPEEYSAIGRNLERDYGVPGSRLWNVQFSDDEKKKQIWVGINARTGELISFSKDMVMNPEDYYNVPEVKVTEKEARKVADGFIQKLQPNKWGQISYRQSEPEIGPWVKMGSAVPRSYHFIYGRTVNGVAYPENGFRVRVSPSTGEVLSYQMTWWETTFPGVQGVLGVAAINEKFLSDHPLILEYSRGHQRWLNEKQRPDYFLIYRPSGSSGAMLDAFSGQEIDYMGKPVIKKGKQPFTDIAGHPAEGDIKLLAQEGILSGEGGKFRPDELATGAEVLAMLVKAYGNYGPYYPLPANDEEPWYNPVVERALARGILDKDFTIDPEKSLNRMQLARLGINAAGWGKLASVSQIFKLDTVDSKSIPAENLGYVAAAVGMELLPLKNGYFEPNQSPTRAQVATFLVKLLKK